jgi:hypothetical protein
MDIDTEIEYNIDNLTKIENFKLKLKSFSEDELHELVKQYRLSAIANENHINNAIDEILATLSTVKLEGYEFRFKSIESILIKLLNNPSKKLRDTLRYTFIIPIDEFSEKLEEIIKIFENYQIYLYEKDKNFKNTFCDGNIYKGVNTSFKYDEFIFEVQFHTQESFNLKMDTHRIYEALRLGNIDECAGIFESIKLSNYIENPDGLDKISKCKKYNIPSKCLQIIRRGGKLLKKKTNKRNIKVNIKVKKEN